LTGSSTNICKGGDGKESRSADKRPKRESQQPRKPMEFQVESYRGGVLRYFNLSNGGPSQWLAVAPDETIEGVKWRLVESACGSSAASRTPSASSVASSVASSRLTFSGRELEDERRLGDLRLETFPTFHLAPVWQRQRGDPEAARRAAVTTPNKHGLVSHDSTPRSTTSETNARGGPKAISDLGAAADALDGWALNFLGLLGIQ